MGGPQSEKPISSPFLRIARKVSFFAILCMGRAIACSYEGTLPSICCSLGVFFVYADEAQPSTPDTILWNTS